MTIRIVLGLILSLLCISTGHAAQIIEVGSDTPTALMPGLEYSIVDTPPQSPETLATLDYRTMAQASLPAVGRSVWFRAELRNSTHVAITRILDLGNGLFDEIEVYFGSGSDWQHHDTGLRYAFESRPLLSLSFAIPLEIPALSQKTLYFRLKSIYQPLTYPQVYSPRQFARANQADTTFSLLVIGIMTGIQLFMLAALALTQKNNTLVAFAITMATLTLTLAYNSGLLFPFLPGPGQSYHSLHIVFICIHSASILFFMRSLFDMSSTMPRLDTATRIAIAFFLALLPALMLLGPGVLIQLLTQVSIGSASLLLLTGIMGIKKRIPSTGFYFTAIAVYALFTTLTVLGAMSVIEYNFWISHYYAIGALCLALLFAMATGHRLYLERQKNQDLSEKALVAETRNAMKSEFLATMSHEIRTPINGVLGMAQMLERSPQSEAQKHFTEVILNSGQTLLHLINDILDMSKVEAGKLELEPGPVDLGQLITFAYANAGTYIGDKPITVRHRIAADVPVYVLADGNRLKQILNNLLSNACKFTERGYVDIEITRVQPSRNGTTRLRLGVKDTGIGIDPAILPQLFEPYTQADKSITRRYGGTGLGLAICKQLTELMGGEIGVRSQPDQGSEFWLELPMTIDEPRQHALEAERVWLRGKRVSLGNLHESHRNLLLEHCCYWGMVPVASLDSAHYPIDLLVLLKNRNDWDPSPWLNHPSCRQSHVLVLIAHHCNGDLPQHNNGPVHGLNVPAGITALQQAMVNCLRTLPKPEKSLLPQPIARRPLSVLVAEDNEVNRLVIRAMLSKLVTRFDIVNDGAEAWQQIQNGQAYDLLLMDCEMPVLDGYNASRQIRQLPGCQTLPIIALTAHAFEANRQRCLDAGMNDMLTKPVDFKTLEACLNRYCPP